jgi:hypothetical protein
MKIINFSVATVANWNWLYFYYRENIRNHHRSPHHPLKLFIFNASRSLRLSSLSSRRLIVIIVNWTHFQHVSHVIPPHELCALIFIVIVSVFFSHTHDICCWALPSWQCIDSLSFLGVSLPSTEVQCVWNCYYSGQGREISRVLFVFNGFSWEACREMRRRD